MNSQEFNSTGGVFRQCPCVASYQTSALYAEESHAHAKNIPVCTHKETHTLKMRQRSVVLEKQMSLQPGKLNVSEFWVACEVLLFPCYGPE